MDFFVYISLFIGMVPTIVATCSSYADYNTINIHIANTIYATLCSTIPRGGSNEVETNMNAPGLIRLCRSDFTRSHIADKAEFKTGIRELAK